MLASFSAMKLTSYQIVWLLVILWDVVGTAISTSSSLIDYQHHRPPGARQKSFPSLRRREGDTPRATTPHHPHDYETSTKDFVMIPILRRKRRQQQLFTNDRTCHTMVSQRERKRIQKLYRRRSESYSFFGNHNHPKRLCSRYSDRIRLRRRGIYGMIPISSSSSLLLASTKRTDDRTSNDDDHEKDYDPNQRMITYDDLTILGKIVAGTIEISITTCMDYVSGFMGGYVLGTILGLPALMTKSSSMTETAATTSARGLRPILMEMQKRTVRMHTKSFDWAKRWGAVSAIYSGFRLLSKNIRGGIRSTNTNANGQPSSTYGIDDDEWNSIISSMGLGAYFSRKEGPQAMIRSALIYGVLSYYLAGFGGARSKLDFHEQPALDF